MTSHPILEQQRAHYAPSKNDPVILAAWRHGGCDTVDLALRFHTTEAHVYSVISARPAARQKPQRLKAPYASRPRPRGNPSTGAIRYFLCDGMTFLHQSGEAITDDRRYAWTGTAEEAEACIHRFPLAAPMNMRVVP